MRFELIDRVLEREPTRLTAVKCVTQAEEYLGDHFPGFAVLPGVMMLEAMVQAARLLVSGREDAPAGPLVVREVRNVKYGNMVRPGETLYVQVTLRGMDGGRFEFQGTGTVHEQTAVQGRFTLEPAPMG